MAESISVQELNDPTMLLFLLVGDDGTIIMMTLHTYCLPEISESGTSQICRNQRNLVLTVIIELVNGANLQGNVLRMKSAVIPNVGI